MSFAKLPTELKVRVIELLVPEQTPHRPTCSLQPQRKRETLKSPILCDLRSLSCVSRDMRSVVAPYFFNAVTLRCTEKSGASVASIASVELAAHVQTLHFEADVEDWLPSEYGADNGGGRDAEPAKPKHFPDSVKEILENLDRFPKLNRLTIEFIVSDEGFEVDPGAIDLFTPPGEDPESSEQRAKVEQSDAWRWIMKQTYDAILKNPPGKIKHLELRNLLPKEVSSWSEPSWHAILGKLESFTITWHGGRTMLEGGLNIFQDYHITAGNTPNYFVDHLSEVTEFRFEAPGDGPMGCDGTFNHVKFFSEEQQRLPKVKKLHFSGIFIDKILLRFIVAHSDTLETLHLSDCLALDHTDYVPSEKNDIAMLWADFLDGIREGEMGKLREVTIGEPTMLPVMFYGGQAELQALQERFPERRVFLYGMLADKDGMLMLDDEHVQDRFDTGEDDRAWRELQKSLEGK